MNRKPEPLSPDVEQTIRENNKLIRTVIRWRWAQVAVMGLGLCVIVMGLTQDASEWLFGRTVGYQLGGIHAPHYSRTEFEQEYLSRVRGRGFNVDHLYIYGQNHHNQFNVEIFVRYVPSNISDRDVLEHLQQVGNSMKDKALPVETPIGP